MRSRVAFLLLRVVPSSVLALAALTFAGCGYHVAGHNDALPHEIHVIAVPALENATTSYRIEQRFTSATVTNFLPKPNTKWCPIPRRVMRFCTAKF